MVEWKPIETYKKLKRRPKGPLIFWFPEIVSTYRHISLPAMHKDNNLSHREASHWAKLVPPEEENNGTH